MCCIILKQFRKKIPLKKSQEFYNWMDSRRSVREYSSKPSPMKFLTKLLKRPSNERAFLLLPIGYAKQPVYVPDVTRKNLDTFAVFYE